MSTITIYGDSPGAPSPMQVMSWDQDFGAQGANRTSGDGADPTTYDDPAGNIDQTAAEQIVGAGWNVSVT